MLIQGPKEIFFLFCMHKMYLISSEGCKNAEVDFLKIRKTDKVWASIKNVHDGLGVKSMPDLFLKEIYGKYGRKNITKNETKKYEITEREICEKFDNLSENELNKKDNKKVYVRNDVIMVLLCIAEVKKRGERRIGGFRKKLKTPESEILQCAEYKIKSKIGKISEVEKILEEYCIKIYEIDSYFYEHFEEKIRVDKNGCNYILLRIDVSFSEYNVAVEVDEKGHTDRDVIFEKKDKNPHKKNLIVNLLESIVVKKIMMQIMKLAKYKHLLASSDIKRELVKENDELKKKIIKDS